MGASLRDVHLRCMHDATVETGKKAVDLRIASENLKPPLLVLIFERRPKEGG